MVRHIASCFEILVLTLASLAATIGALGFVMATVVLVVLGDDVFDFGITAAHSEFSASLKTFCTMVNVKPIAPSLVLVKLVLAVALGAITALLFFPHVSLSRASVCCASDRKGSESLLTCTLR